MLIALQIYVWQQNLHATRPFAPQHIGLVLDTAVLIPKIVFSYGGFLRTLAVVENSELGTQEIGPYFSQITIQ